MSRELNEESAKKFYEVTENMLEQLAHSQGIDDLSEYYELTDFKIGAYGELLINYGDSISRSIYANGIPRSKCIQACHNREIPRQSGFFERQAVRFRSQTIP